MRQQVENLAVVLISPAIGAMEFSVGVPCDVAEAGGLFTEEVNLGFLYWVKSHFLHPLVSNIWLNWEALIGVCFCL